MRILIFSVPARPICLCHVRNDMFAGRFLFEHFDRTCECSDCNFVVSRNLVPAESTKWEKPCVP